MPVTPVQTFVTQVGWAKETTWSTPVTATAFFAVNAPQPKDDYKTLLDNGNRGLPSKDFAYYQGVGNSENEWKSRFYPDDTGHWLTSIMGVDSITGAGPYTHVIGAATTLPPSYTVVDYSGLTSGGQARRYAGSYASSLVLDWNSDGDFIATVHMTGLKSATVAKPSAVYSSQNIFLPWQGALTLNSSSNTQMMDFSLTVKRTLDVIFASAGTQDPICIVPGPIEVTGSGNFLAANEAEFLLYLNNTQGNFSHVLTSGTNVLTIQMTKCALESPTSVERGKEYVTAAASFRGISNTTDKATGGATAGPILFTLVNGRSTAYTA